MHTHTNGYAHPCTHMCTASLGTWFAVVPKGVSCCHSYAEYKKGGSIIYVQHGIFIDCWKGKNHASGSGTVDDTEYTGFPHCFVNEAEPLLECQSLPAALTLAVSY